MHKFEKDLQKPHAPIYLQCRFTATHTRIHASFDYAIITDLICIQYFMPTDCRVGTVALFEFYVDVDVCVYANAGKQHRIQTTAE